MTILNFSTLQQSETLFEFFEKKSGWKLESETFKNKSQIAKFNMAVKASFKEVLVNIEEYYKKKGFQCEVYLLDMKVFNEHERLFIFIYFSEQSPGYIPCTVTITRLD